MNGVLVKLANQSGCAASATRTLMVAGSNPSRNMNYARVFLYCTLDRFGTYDKI